MPPAGDCTKTSYSLSFSEVRRCDGIRHLGGFYFELVFFSLPDPVDSAIQMKVLMMKMEVTMRTEVKEEGQLAASGLGVVLSELQIVALF
ncbi:hypothetical protein AAFF_G00145240 [Aldrovandia affinis]|uniref:Uncharacterized protein n=1 Tax=Aldrovandia affinis TaxID=143900 RepID=A0AAD7WWZ3_9TELE|nr:hypothetical protein AAFF_G00145240 [Aldrovandia affinis]